MSANLEARGVEGIAPGRSVELLASLRTPRRFDPAAFAAAMLPVEQHLQRHADALCCPIAHLEQGLERVDDESDFIADVDTSATLDLFHIYGARHVLQQLVERAEVERLQVTPRRAAQLAIAWQRVLDVLPLSALAVLVEVGSRLTTPCNPALARLPLVAPPASAKGQGAHPTIRPRTRHWAGSKVWLLPGGQCLQTFADIDEWHAVASVHRTAPGALPKLQQAFIGDDAAEPFTLLFAAGGGQPESPPGEAALAKMLASLRQAETTLGCHLGMRAITETQAGALQAPPV
jgi:hypothetical protein